MGAALSEHSNSEQLNDMPDGSDINEITSVVQVQLRLLLISIWHLL